jgi:hypothetical protein
MAAGTNSLGKLKDLANAILLIDVLDDPLYVNRVLIRLFVVAHYAKLPRHSWSWVDIARQANVDPGTLATESTNNFIESITDKMWPLEKVSPALTPLSYV